MKKIFLIILLSLFTACSTSSAPPVNQDPPGMKALHDFLGIPSNAAGYGKTYGHTTMLAIDRESRNITRLHELRLRLIGVGKEPSQAISEAQSYARQAALARTRTVSVVSIRVTSLAVILGMLAIIIALACFYLLLGFFYPLVNRYEINHRPGPAYTIGIVFSIFIILVLLTASVKAYAVACAALLVIAVVIVLLRREYLPEEPQRIDPFS